MNLPEYISADEVKKVSKKLGISDWSKKKEAKVTIKEAEKILKQLDAGPMKVDPEQFRAGLEVELEHGTRFPQYNVTNNHPVLTGKIVLAHFMEMLDYYQRLEIAELEGDLMKAIQKRDMDKTFKYYKKISKAREVLSLSEQKRLK